MLEHELPQQVVVFRAGLCKAAITKVQVALRMIDFVITGASKKIMKRLPTSQITCAFADEMINVWGQWSGCWEEAGCGGPVPRGGGWGPGLPHAAPLRSGRGAGTQSQAAQPVRSLSSPASKYASCVIVSGSKS